MTLDEVKAALAASGYQITSEVPMANNLGHRLDVAQGGNVNVYGTGTVQVQGKANDALKALFAGQSNGKAKATTPVAAENRQVFVVYGHDDVARNSLEAMLRRWKLEPVILDQLPSGGQTIIEKLMGATQLPCFAVVLATPDDEGNKRDKPDEKMHRARQNVVLELGMMLARLGRQNVAIMLKQATQMERPSDIQGLLYIPFENDPAEARLTLAKEINDRGIKIDLSKV